MYVIILLLIVFNISINNSFSLSNGKALVPGICHKMPQMACDVTNSNPNKSHKQSTFESSLKES